MSTAEIKQKFVIAIASVRVQMMIVIGKTKDNGNTVMDFHLRTVTK